MVALKGAIGDAGNGEKAQRGRDLDLTARAGITRDDGLAQDVLVGKVAGLGLCDGLRLDGRGLGRDGLRRHRAQPRRHCHQRDRGGHDRTGKALLGKKARRHGGFLTFQAFSKALLWPKPARAAPPATSA